MKRGKQWIPSSMEETCLRQLDRPGSWSWLRSEQPEQTDAITWRSVRRIFWFNFGLFITAIALVLTLLAHGSGYTSDDFKEDLLSGLFLTFLIAFGMAVFATNLYRRAWNRRARFLRQQDDID